MKKPRKKPKKSDFTADVNLIFRELEQLKADIEQMQKYIGVLAGNIGARTGHFVPTLKPHYSEPDF